MGSWQCGAFGDCGFFVWLVVVLFVVFWLVGGFLFVFRVCYEAKSYEGLNINSFPYELSRPGRKN